MTKSYSRFGVCALAAIAAFLVFSHVPEAYAQFQAPSSFDEDPVDKINNFGSTVLLVIAAAVAVCTVLAIGFVFLQAAGGTINKRLITGILVGGGGISSVFAIAGWIIGS